MWKQSKISMWPDRLSRSALNWWARLNRFRHSRSQESAIPIHRQVQDGWVDFFIGDAQGARCHRLLDSKAKVGLHFRAFDLEKILPLACPSPEIPDHLWQQLKYQYSLGCSRYSRMSHYFHQWTQSYTPHL